MFKSTLYTLQVAGVTTRTRYSQCGNQRTSLPELEYLRVQSVWARDIAPRGHRSHPEINARQKARDKTPRVQPRHSP